MIGFRAALLASLVVASGFGCGSAQAQQSTTVYTTYSVGKDYRRHEAHEEIHEEERSELLCPGRFYRLFIVESAEDPNRAHFRNQA